MRKLFILISLIIILSITAFGADTVSLQINDYEINSQSIDGTEYLFIPSFVDLTNISLSANAKISFGEASSAIDISGGVNVNLTELVGKDIVAGEKYILNLYNSNNELLQKITLMQSANISTLFITSDKSVADHTDSKGLEGKGKLYMYRADGTLVNENSDLKKIKGRGNSGWSESGDKKPFNINLTEKAELVEGAGAYKKWCLITDNTEAAFAGHFANSSSYDLYSLSGGVMPIHYEFVDLFFNGEYRGIYLVTDKVEINEGRVDITETQYDFEDEENTSIVAQSSIPQNNPPKHWSRLEKEVTVITDGSDDILNSGIQVYSFATNSKVKEGTTSGGFLVELDQRFYAEASWFVTRRGIPYVVKEPEFVTREQLKTIAVYFQEFEDALCSETGYNDKGKYYTEYIDLDSLTKRLAVDLYTSQIDTWISSCYFSVDRENDGSLGKIISGPAWDYDVCDYNVKGFMYLYDTKEFIREFLKHGDLSANLYNLVENQFNTAISQSTKALGERIENYKSAYLLNSAMWNSDGTNPDPESYDVFFEKYTSRAENWKETFEDDFLFGVSCSQKDGTIYAQINGKADRIAWFSLDKKSNTLTEIEGENSLEFTPGSDGIYFCKAFGTTEPSLEIDSMLSAPISIGDQGSTNLALTSFEDVEIGSYYEKAVKWAVDNGVTSGTSKTTFSPYDSCTRGQVVTFLWRAKGCPEPTSQTNPFTDVNSGDYYYKAVLWAVENNITSGTSKTTFSPKDTCTNAHVITFLHRANGTPKAEGESETAAGYPDKFYTDALAWADTTGLLSGIPDSFIPDNSAPRAVIVTYLYLNDK